jgi:hypothetical protein
MVTTDLRGVAAHHDTLGRHALPCVSLLEHAISVHTGREIISELAALLREAGGVGGATASDAGTFQTRCLAQAFTQAFTQVCTIRATVGSRTRG